VHEVGAHDPVREPGVVLDLGGEHQLAARVDPFDHERTEICAGRVQVTVGTPLADVEEMLIRATLDAVGGTRHRAASLLGISPKTLYNKLQRMRLN